MTGTIYIMKVLLCTASFLLLCVAAMKVNLNRTERARQFAMPGIALVYGVLALVFVSDLYAQIARLLAFLEGRLPFVEALHLNQYLIYLANAAIVLGFLVVKAAALPVLSRVWGGSAERMEMTSGHFYEYDRELDKWFIQPRLGQVRFYYKGIYISAVILSAAVFVLSRYFPDSVFFQAAFFPVFGVMIIGEVVSFLDGLTRTEFVEDILGEDEEAYRIANDGLLREVY